MMSQKRFPGPWYRHERHHLQGTGPPGKGRRAVRLNEKTRLNGETKHNN